MPSGLKFGVGEIILPGLIFLVCLAQNHFLSIKFFFKLDSSDYLGFVEKLV